MSLLIKTIILLSTFIIVIANIPYFMGVFVMVFAITITYMQYYFYQKKFTYYIYLIISILILFYNDYFIFLIPLFVFDTLSKKITIVHL